MQHILNKVIQPWWLGGRAVSSHSVEVGCILYIRSQAQHGDRSLRRAHKYRTIEGCKMGILFIKSSLKAQKKTFTMEAALRGPAGNL